MRSPTLDHGAPCRRPLVRALPIAKSIGILGFGKRQSLERRTDRMTGLTLAILGWTGLAADVNPARPPNLVVIVSDDQGYGDLGCFGSSRVQTPALGAGVIG